MDYWYQIKYDYPGSDFGPKLALWSCGIGIISVAKMLFIHELKNNHNIDCTVISIEGLEDSEVEDFPKEIADIIDQFVQIYNGKN